MEEIKYTEQKTFEIITNFSKKLFSESFVDNKKSILFERIENGDLLIDGKPSLYKQIIDGKQQKVYTNRYRS